MLVWIIVQGKVNMCDTLEWRRLVFLSPTWCVICRGVESLNPMSSLSNSISSLVKAVLGESCVGSF